MFVCEILREIKPRERMCVHCVQAREANGARWIHRVRECFSNIEQYRETVCGIQRQDYGECVCEAERHSER